VQRRRSSIQEKELVGVWPEPYPVLLGHGLIAHQAPLQFFVLNIASCTPCGFGCSRHVSFYRGLIGFGSSEGFPSERLV
jgi:hypothetical protein